MKKTAPAKVAAGKPASGARKQTALVSAALFALVWVVFFPVLQFDYVNVDDPSCYTNEHVQAGLTWVGIKWAFTTWHPLTWISHMLDVQLFGPGASGPHGVNLLLHGANAVLVLELLRRLTGALWPGAVVAALFAFHPQQVETLAWVTERKGALSSFFGLLTLWAYARYATRDGSRFYWLALACFALGLLSKPMIVTWPLVMLLLDFWPLGRMNAIAGGTKWRVLILEKIPFVALTALSGLLTTALQKDLGTLQSFGEHTLGRRISDALMAYLHYLGKTFWPVDLAVPIPRHGIWPMGEVIIAALLLAGLCGLAVWYGRRFPFLFTGCFWFLGTLVPVLGLVQIAAQTVADRYQYLPCLGLFVLLTWGAREIARRRRLAGVYVAGLAGLILLALAARSRDQLRHWQNAETLAKHAIAVAPDNWLAQYCLGWHYDLQNRKAEAIEHYRLAAQIKPNYAEPWNGLGCIYAEQKNFAEALPCFEAAVRTRPDKADFRYNFSKALGATGRVPEACEQLEEALRRDPDFAPAHNELGLALAYQRKFTEAIPHLQTAVRLKPGEAGWQFDLGKTLATAGQAAAAIPPLEESLRLAPDNLQAHYVLGTALAATGRIEEAIARFQYVLERKPNQVSTRFALGQAFATLGQTNAAIQQFQETLRLQTNSAQAKQALRALGVTVSE